MRYTPTNVLTSAIVFPFLVYFHQCCLYQKCSTSVHVAYDYYCQISSRMDHHCPWINNCVGDGNHLAFLVAPLAMLAAAVVHLYDIFCAAYYYDGT